MSSEGEKKASCGWRVKVRNVIKVVSSNRKPSKMRPELEIRNSGFNSSRSDQASSIKSPKFHVSAWTSSESDKEKFVSGELMMLDVAETKFGIKPLRKKFGDQKLLIYTLPNENNSLCQIPVENLVNIADDNFKLETERKPMDIIETTKINTIASAYADIEKIAKVEAITAEASETGDQITIQTKSNDNLDGKECLVTNCPNGRPEPGKEEGARSVSLFSSPLPPDDTSVKGMYFGPHSINLQLDVN